MLKCPNNHEIDHVLVCGGEGNNGENVYFRMNLNGEYSHLLADGEPGVTEDMKDHADGGCCSEGICPECKEEVIQQQP